MLTSEFGMGKLLFDEIFVENSMKLKELAEEGASLAIPLDPPMTRTSIKTN